MFRYILLLATLFLAAGSILGQTQNDTLFCYKTKIPVTIDGQATEECWAKAEWHAIDQVWIPWAEKMKEGDFSGRFKVSWDVNYLYVLVEVVDDSLSDDHSNPLQNWWDDDCLELFIDENRSKGDHERNNNAFAYHVSLFYDAVDLNSAGQGINYKNNIEVDMDTIGVHTYLWEFAVKNYDASFSIYNPEASRVYLHHNKNMGFAIAYCDNDEKTTRENFIGSMVMNPATANEMYRNANYFGLMVLVDPDSVSTNVVSVEKKTEVSIYPVPARDWIKIERSGPIQSPGVVSISTITGQFVKEETVTEKSIFMPIGELAPGIYLVKFSTGKDVFTKTIVKH